MNKESSKVERRPQHQAPHKQSRLDQKKRWEDETNDFLEPADMEETKGNEINNDTWIKVAQNRERWKAMDTDHALQQRASTDPMQEDA